MKPCGCEGRPGCLRHLAPGLRTVDGVDGFVSLEVSPYLAHDTQGTIKEANRLCQAVGRANCFIKIPVQRRESPQSKSVLYQGLNINITLLFSVQELLGGRFYAYIRALERRTAEGKPVKQLASVASFFLHRIDTLTDQLLGHRDYCGCGKRVAGPERWLGKAAVVSAELAYASFKRILSGCALAKARGSGTKTAASSAHSGPAPAPSLYRDLNYVEPLIGPHTVNTMPEQTIAAFADHGILEANTIEKGVEEAHQIVSALEKLGVSLRFCHTPVGQ